MLDFPYVCFFIWYYPQNSTVFIPTNNWLATGYLNIWSIYFNFYVGLQKFWQLGVCFVLYSYRTRRPGICFSYSTSIFGEIVKFLYSGISLRSLILAGYYISLSLIPGVFGTVISKWRLLFNWHCSNTSFIRFWFTGSLVFHIYMQLGARLSGPAIGDLSLIFWMGNHHK